VMFDIDANGILKVSAKDQATAREQSIRIEASSGLSESEIQRMVHDAEEHKADDQKRRDTIELRNRADQVVYETEKNLREIGTKLDPAARAKLESEVENLKGAIKSEDESRLRAAVDAVSKAWHEASARLYAEAQRGAEGAAGGPGASAGPTGSAESGGSDRGKVVDADFEVVDDR